MAVPDERPEAQEDMRLAEALSERLKQAECGNSRARQRGLAHVMRKVLHAALRNTGELDAQRRVLPG